MSIIVLIIRPPTSSSFFLAGKLPPITTGYACQAAMGPSRSGLIRRERSLKKWAHPVRAYLRAESVMLDDGQTWHPGGHSLGWHGHTQPIPRAAIQIDNQQITGPGGELVPVFRRRRETADRCLLRFQRGLHLSPKLRLPSEQVNAFSGLIPRDSHSTHIASRSIRASVLLPSIPRGPQNESAIKACTGSATTTLSLRPSESPAAALLVLPPAAAWAGSVAGNLLVG